MLHLFAALSLSFCTLCCQKASAVSSTLRESPKFLRSGQLLCKLSGGFLKTKSPAFSCQRMSFSSKIPKQNLLKFFVDKERAFAFKSRSCGRFLHNGKAQPYSFRGDVAAFAVAVAGMIVYGIYDFSFPDQGKILEDPFTVMTYIFDNWDHMHALKKRKLSPVYSYLFHVLLAEEAHHHCTLVGWSYEFLPKALEKLLPVHTKGIAVRKKHTPNAFLVLRATTKLFAGKFVSNHVSLVLFDEVTRDVVEKLRDRNRKGKRLQPLSGKQLKEARSRASDFFDPACPLGGLFQTGDKYREDQAESKHTQCQQSCQP